MTQSNVGQRGIDSIRIDGLKIGNLPLGQGNEAKGGLADFILSDKETRRNNVRAKFPQHKIKFLKAQMNECKNNISKIRAFKIDLKDQIAAYRKIIVDCDYRDREMLKYNVEHPEDAAAMKALRLKFPPYNIDALNQQINQFEDSIDRCDKVIEQDYDSISEIQKVLTLAEQRERELKNI